MARDPGKGREVGRDPGARGRRARRSRGEEPRPARGRGTGDGQADALEALLTGGAPREVLARLVDGDPLGLELRCRERLGEVALMLDLERLFLRAVARVAFAAPRRERGAPLADWLARAIDRATADLVDEDRAAERAGAPLGAGEPRYAFLAEALGVEPRVARRACVVFNDLPPRVRRAYWSLVVEGRSLRRCASEGLGPPELVERDVRRALLALSLLEDPGPQRIEGGDDDEL